MSTLNLNKNTNDIHKHELNNDNDNKKSFGQLDGLESILVDKSHFFRESIDSFGNLSFLADKDDE